MPLRHTLTRTGIALAVGTLIAVAGATPALADDGSGSGLGGSSLDLDNGDGRFGDAGPGDGRFDDDRRDPRFAEGRITSRDGLALHSRPSRGGRIIRIARFGERVAIFCQTAGERVGDNPFWYLLADGTWAWGPARHIVIIGPSPRWC